MNVRDGVAHKVRLVLEGLAEGRAEPWMALYAREALPSFKPRAVRRPRLPSSKFVDDRKRRELEEEIAAVKAMRDQVFEWNAANTGGAVGRCDNDECPRPFFPHAQAGELDHWIERSQGGTHTRENGWRLCTACHHEKTSNRPDRATWNERRRRYCERAGVPFVPRRER